MDERNTRKQKNNKIIIYCIYSILFTLFVFKMFFYANQMFEIPDSDAHLSYIIYMEKNEDKFIPAFEDMTLYEIENSYVENNQIIYKMAETPMTCYLGHPPLYYKMMQLCNAVEIIDDGSVYLNATILSNVNIFLTAITMLVCLMIGYKFIEKHRGSWCLHLFYVAICTSIPLYGYLGSAPNNDNLCNVGAVIFLCGLISYLEKGYSYKTFWLVALGIVISVMSKLTMGLIVVIVTFVFVIADILKERKLTIICNRYFLSSLPIYIGAVIYFLIIYNTYGAVQPAYQSFVSNEEFVSSQFYVVEEARVYMTFWQDVVHFFKGMLQTWCGTYNVSYMLDRSSLIKIVHLAVIVMFFITGCKEFIDYIKKRGKSTNILTIAFGLAIIIATLRQFVGHYTTYMIRGYTGGYQSRYYMPCIPVIAMGACQFVFMLKNKLDSRQCTIGKLLLVIMSVIVVYGDFLYFVLNVYSIL